MGFISAAVDTASFHLGKVAREIKRGKDALGGLNCKSWSPCDVADDIDEEDVSIGGESHDKYCHHGRPYLVYAGIEDSIFTMSPLMTKVATSAKFIQCDVTYESKEYPVCSMQLLPIPPLCNG